MKISDDKIKFLNLVLKKYVKCFLKMCGDPIWIIADDAYIVGELYTLEDPSVWFFAEKLFLSIDSVWEPWWHTWKAVGVSTVQTMVECWNYPM